MTEWFWPCTFLSSLYGVHNARLAYHHSLFRDGSLHAIPSHGPRIALGLHCVRCTQMRLDERHSSAILRLLCTVVGASPVSVHGSVRKLFGSTSLSASLAQFDQHILSIQSWFCTRVSTQILRTYEQPTKKPGLRRTSRADSTRPACLVAPAGVGAIHRHRLWGWHGITPYP